MYDRLFKPLTIGLREARNRVLFGSHATNLARHNLLSSQHADYYAARAEGGAGIIVLEEHIVHVSDMPYESAVLGYLPNTVQAVAAAEGAASEVVAAAAVAAVAAAVAVCRGELAAGGARLA